MNKIKYFIFSTLLLIVLLASLQFLIYSIIGSKGLSNLLLFLSVCSVFYIGFLIFKDYDEPEEFFTEKLKDRILPKFKISWFILLLILTLTFLGIHFSKKLPSLYNKSIIYYKNYEQKTSERAGYYDKLWKSFKQKSDITFLNKETFIQVTQIIMDGRRDGQALIWKWLSENQPIPYQEFTRFYSDLSGFIEEQREGYYALEKECQKIAMAHNMLIDTFPNNVYNLVLNRKPIKYSYGFLSDSTNKVFSTGRENLQ